MMLVVVGSLVLVAAFFALNTYKTGENRVGGKVDFKDATYIINNTPITLKDGFLETETAPGSASKVTIRYFGNDYEVDLNNDGREDIVFLVTEETGGSGVFFYVVAALNTEEGYIGSDGYLLGDRIAPQTIESSPNPRHKNVIVANYVDRGVGEAMSVQPSIGKSAYLKLDPSSMTWGIVEPDFEGESR